MNSAYLDITENVSKKMKEMKENKFQLQPSNLLNTFSVGFDTIASFVQDVTSSVDRNFDTFPEEDRKAAASSKLRLLVGAAIVNQIRAAVKKETQYDCSAGIAHNKILAKLTCGMNKPNKQTILPIESITGLFNDLAVNKVKSLGGKLGEEVCTKLNAKTMSDILIYSETELQNHFQPRVGSWLYWMARGIDLEKVTPKFMSKSIAVSKNFRGKNEIASILTLKFWLKELAKEIVERLEKDQADCNRSSKQLVVSFTHGDAKSVKGDVACSRTVPLNGSSLNTYNADQIANEAFEVIKKNSTKFLKAEGSVIMSHSIKHLGITAGKFEDDNAAGSSKSLQDLLKNHKKEPAKAKSPPLAQPKSDDVKRPADAIKKFEMKSPKPMMKFPEVPEARAKIPSPKVELPSSITTTESFAGDFSIQGVNTLRHWVEQILSELCIKISADSEIHQRAPTEININYTQLVNRKKKETVAKLPLENFADNIIDVDVVVELLTNSDGFLRDGAKKIQHPIVRLEITASNFDSNNQFCYTVKNVKSLVAQAQEVKTANPEEVPTADVPDETEEVQSDDEKFLLEVQQELNDMNEQEVTETEDIASVDTEPESPEYDPEPIEEDVSEADEMAAVEETNPTSSVLEQVSSDPDGAGPSYLQTYAEFQPQNISIEMLNPKEPCPDCGKMIGKLDMGTHLDHHLALELSKQQREEYRHEQRKVIPQKAVKKVVQKKNQQKKSQPNSIEKYAVKSNQRDDESTENKLKCEQCQKWIATEEYISHLDYHHARRLRDEEMKTTARPSPPLKQSVNRKRPASTQKNQPKLKSIKSFLNSS